MFFIPQQSLARLCFKSSACKSLKLWRQLHLFCSFQHLGPVWSSLHVVSVPCTPGWCFSRERSRQLQPIIEQTSSTGLLIRNKSFWAALMCISTIQERRWGAWKTGRNAVRCQRWLQSRWLWRWGVGDGWRVAVPPSRGWRERWGPTPGWEGTEPGRDAWGPWAVAEVGECRREQWTSGAGVAGGSACPSAAGIPPAGSLRTLWSELCLLSGAQRGESPRLRPCCSGQGAISDLLGGSP